MTAMASAAARAAIRARNPASKQTVKLLNNWVGAESSTLSARAKTRDSKRLSTTWMASASQAQKVGSRAAARDSKSLIFSWLSQEAPVVARRAAARDSHSLLSTWAASASQTAAKRAGARDARSLLYSWILKDGLAKAVAKAPPMRSPLSNPQLLYRWIIADGVSRYGADAAMVAKRGLKPAQQFSMLHSWIIKEGHQKIMASFAARTLAASFAISAVALTATTLYTVAKEMSAHKQTRVLARRSSMMGARQAQKVALKYI